MAMQGKGATFFISGTAAICLITLVAGRSLAVEMPPATQGQTVYVPVYSEVLHGNANSKGSAETWLLSATLSIQHRPRQCTDCSLHWLL